MRAMTPPIISSLFLGLLTPVIASSIDQSLAESYAPIYVDCPSNVSWIRSSSTGLSPEEQKWIRGRKQVVLEALESYLERLALDDFDTRDYIERLRSSGLKNVPTLGLAISGGGWASALTGTGAIRALDNRLEDAVAQRTGGLLQALTYISGLSGGSFPTVSFATSNFPTADEIVDQWHPEISRLDTNQTIEYAEDYTDIFTDLGAKFKAGFPVSFSDFFGRVTGYEFVAGPKGGLNATWSGVTKLSKFVDYQMPLPIVHLSSTLSEDPEFAGVRLPPSNSTIFDLTPFEFGAWSGSVSAFTPTEFLGTHLINGQPINKSACVRGFDRAGFTMGSSATAINMWYAEDLTNGTVGAFAKRSASLQGCSILSRDTASSGASPFTITTINQIFSIFNTTFKENISISAYAEYPNPFTGLPTTTASLSNTSYIKFVDGSEGGQTIPFWGQIQPARDLDFILAWENSEDAAPYHWNNGTNLYNTYLAANKSGIPFPIVPDATTIVTRNFSIRPTFFGCDANLTTTGSTDSPIILFYANAPYSAYTNYSYAQAATTRSQINDIFVNSFNQITAGNGTLDAEWAACLGCAAIDRSLTKVGLNRTEQCQQCFNEYCWDGTYDNTTPSIMDVSLILDPGLGFEEWNKTHEF